MNRYLASYTIARLMVVSGTAVMILGVIVGVLVFIAATTNENATAGAKTFAYAVSIGLGSLVSGLFIVGTGRLLSAALDIAVHTSPFMNYEEKASLVGAEVSIDSRRKAWSE
jgi:hypothetical protein